MARGVIALREAAALLNDRTHRCEDCDLREHAAPRRQAERATFLVGPRLEHDLGELPSWRLDVSGHGDEPRAVVAERSRREQAFRRRTAVADREYDVASGAK